ncbi:F0F1 ATP synthase subunit epsilon [soil metagenome]
MSIKTAQIDPQHELETPPADLSTKKVLGGQIQCVVVTPEKVVIDELVGFVALPLYDGELGVSPGRTPLIGRLGFGELRIRTATTTRRYFLDGGFAQVRDDIVTVLTNRAVAAGKIDTQAAKEDLDRARTRRASTDLDQMERQRTIDRARAQLRVAGHKLRVS